MSDIEKDKSSFTGAPSSNREKPHSFRGNGGKRSRNYGSGRNNPRNGNGNSNLGNEAGSKDRSNPVDLSNITLTEEERKRVGFKKSQIQRHSFSYKISS